MSTARERPLFLVKTSLLVWRREISYVKSDIKAKFVDFIFAVLVFVVHKIGLDMCIASPHLEKNTRPRLVYLQHHHHHHHLITDEIESYAFQAMVILGNIYM